MNPGMSSCSGQEMQSMLSTSEIDAATFHADVQYIEALWQPVMVCQTEMQVIDVGSHAGDPLIFVPILEQLEFVYARQIRAFSRTRRVILYRRREARTRPVELGERAEELAQILDALGLDFVDLVGHGDAAMVLLEFAARYPRRCRSLIIIAQGADYQIAPHPFIWYLHELFLRLPVEHVLPAWFLRHIVVDYITARKPGPIVTVPREEDPWCSLGGGSHSHWRDLAQPALCILPRVLIEEQFRKIALWPRVYKFSVLPIIHRFDMRERLGTLTMPILLINRADDVLSPVYKTRWLAGHLPNCFGHYVIPGGERFFMYAQAAVVTALMNQFLTRIQRN